MREKYQLMIFRAKYFLKGKGKGVKCEKEE
jgi:hypothetical protein